MQLMMQGNRRGLPMRPSPELEQMLRGMAGSETALSGQTPEAFQMLEDAGEKLSLHNERVIPQRPPTGEPFDFEDIHNSQWDRGMMDEPIPSAGPEREPDLVDLMGGPTRAVEGSGQFFIMARNKQGKAIRLDGPFSSEIEAMSELRKLQEAGAKNIELFIGNPHE